MTSPKPKHFLTSLFLTYELRARLDALRLARARNAGGLPPTLKQVVTEALEEFVARECPPVH